ncbi:hypothetical protein [Halobacteriovorax sp.]|uniref:hypothetical protein n=1 Tax=Halobacteriovorax sp. TaxID=2020862 RepID=UPI003AF2BB5E
MHKLNLLILAILFSSLTFASEGNDIKDNDTQVIEDDIKIEFTTACVLQGVFLENLPIRVKLSSYYREWSRREIVENISLEECERMALEIANLDDGIWDIKHQVTYKTVSARIWFKNFKTGELIEDEIFRVSLH